MTIAAASRREIPAAAVSSDPPAAIPQNTRPRAISCNVASAEAVWNRWRMYGLVMAGPSSIRSVAVATAAE